MCLVKKCASLLFASFLGILVSSLIEPVPASAQTLEWTFVRQHHRTIHFKLYSRNRDFVWPDRSNHWVLNDFSPHTVRVNCYAGETICYGAWDAFKENVHWGAGRGGQRGCPNCCITCNQSGGKGSTTLLDVPDHID